uniref:Uncharacterized protein n=1 Tax=Human herpesvirus 2 TaxID=10310 RepID=A0A481TJT1_HHV2|nr:hypothetical protein [Human alphaherpesvirus 2]
MGETRGGRGPGRGGRAKEGGGWRRRWKAEKRRMEGQKMGSPDPPPASPRLPFSGPPRVPTPPPAARRRRPKHRSRRGRAGSGRPGGRMAERERGGGERERGGGGGGRGKATGKRGARKSSKRGDRASRAECGAPGARGRSRAAPRAPGPGRAGNAPRRPRRREPLCHCLRGRGPADGPRASRRAAAPAAHASRRIRPPRASGGRPHALPLSTPTPACRAPAECSAVAGAVPGDPLSRRRARAPPACCCGHFCCVIPVFIKPGARQQRTQGPAADREGLRRRKAAPRTGAPFSSPLPTSPSLPPFFPRLPSSSAPPRVRLCLGDPRAGRGLAAEVRPGRRGPRTSAAAPSGAARSRKARKGPPEAFFDSRPGVPGSRPAPGGRRPPPGGPARAPGGARGPRGPGPRRRRFRVPFLLPPGRPAPGPDPRPFPSPRLPPSRRAPSLFLLSLSLARCLALLTFPPPPRRRRRPLPASHRDAAPREPSAGGPRLRGGARLRVSRVRERAPRTPRVLAGRFRVVQVSFC